MFRIRGDRLKSGFYLKNPPDFISNDLDIDVNYACLYTNMEKWDEICLKAKKEFPTNYFNFSEKSVGWIKKNEYSKIPITAKNVIGEL